KASSESLTHGVIYTSAPKIGAVIHVHNSQIWQGLLDRGPTTKAKVALWNARDGSRNAEAVL
ncbi:MAG: hypothetical protein WA949_10870, partial [Phormidesmis sp.]